MHYAVRDELKEKSQRQRPQSDGQQCARDFDDIVLPSKYLACKGACERLSALLLLLAATPVLLVLVAIVRATSSGPAVYRQTRVGLHGRTFTMYKFRSMRQDAEAGTGAVWAQSGDPRVTPVGRVMRRLHLDEIPQLVNVVKGDMALIGPRPERPEFTHVLALKLPGYMQRHRVRPGITGLAQLNLPPDSDLESVRRKLVLDLDYIDRSGLGIDLRIACATIMRMLYIRQSVYVRLTGLKPHSEVLYELKHGFVSGEPLTSHSLTHRPRG
jgi:lipopolysaccharide/colanic/teichoic acid biosynthesis glycosyltransferase